MVLVGFVAVVVLSLWGRCMSIFRVLSIFLCMRNEGYRAVCKCTQRSYYLSLNVLFCIARF